MTARNRVLKLQFFNLKKASQSFWLVMAVLNLLGYMFAFNPKWNLRYSLVRYGQYSSVSGANYVPLIIFFLVYGIVSYHDGFRMALSMGATRKDFYKTLLLVNGLAPLGFSLIQASLDELDKILLKSSGLFKFYDNGLANFLIILAIFYSVLVFTGALGNMAGILNFRFGKWFWISSFILGIILLRLVNNFFPQLVVLVTRILDLMIPRFGFYSISILCLMPSIILYGLGYLVFKKANY